MSLWFKITSLHAIKWLLWLFEASIICMWIQWVHCGKKEYNAFMMIEAFWVMSRLIITLCFSVYCLYLSYLGKWCFTRLVSNRFNYTFGLRNTLVLRLETIGIGSIFLSMSYFHQWRIMASIVHQHIEIRLGRFSVQSIHCQINMVEMSQVQVNQWRGQNGRKDNQDRKSINHWWVVRIISMEKIWRF